MVTPLPIVVLASGRGGTFAALNAAQRSGRLAVDIRALLSDRRTAPVLEIAESAGIATVALRPRDFPDRVQFDRALFARAAAFAPELIVLAGYMRIIDAAVVADWAGRIINLHPSLLPKFPGLDTYARALAAAENTFGASIHYVTSQLDGGPVIAQVELPILPGDTPDLMAARLRPAEQNLLIGVVKLIAERRLAPTGDAVELDGLRLERPLIMDADGGFSGL